MAKFRSNLERRFHLLHPALPYEQHKLAYQQLHHYTPDFQLTPNHFVEVKGLFTAQDRGKHLQIQKQHPDIKVTFVFQDPNRRLSKTSRTTYAAWCDAHNIPWLHINDAANL